MKKLLAASFVLAFAFLACFTMTASDAADNGILLYEINPTGDDEGVTLCNYSSSTIDLKNYAVSDNPSLSSGEGSFIFKNSIELGPGECITIVKDKHVPSSKFIGRYTTYSYNTNGIESAKTMNLADGGDDVYLFLTDGTKILEVKDAFCYGSKTITDSELWSGDSFKIKKDCFAERKDKDSNTASDWFNYKIGWTNIIFDPSVKYSATVTPFVFPESGGIPVYETLKEAKSSVYLSMYQLSSENVISLLDDLLKSGIELNILLQGTEKIPVAVNHTLEAIRRWSMMVLMSDSSITMGDTHSSIQNTASSMIKRSL